MIDGIATAHARYPPCEITAPRFIGTLASGHIGVVYYTDEKLRDCCRTLPVRCFLHGSSRPRQRVCAKVIHHARVLEHGASGRTK